jgi:hypothetical protein
MHMPAAHPEWAEWTINKEMVSTNRVDGPADAGPFFLNPTPIFVRTLSYDPAKNDYFDRCHTIYMGYGAAGGL